VEVLTDQQQWLHLALAQQHPLEGIACALSALRRIELRKGAVGRQRLQERQERRHGVVQHLVQCQNLASQPGPDGARVIAVVHMTIALEQVHDREIGRGFAVGHRGALQDPPALKAVRVDELIDEARLPDPGIPDQGRRLPVSGLCPRQGLHQGRHFRVAADKAGEPPDCGRLQAPPDAARADQLKDFYRRCETFDRHGAQRGDLHISLSQTQRRLGQQN
jgi:hypothetical protein